MRSAYPDLLSEEADPALVRVAQVLDAGYNLQRAPASMRTMAPRRFPAHIREKLDALDRAHAAVAKRPRRWRLHTKLYTAFVLVAALVVLLASNVSDAGPKQRSITDLGKPTNAVAQYFPLGGFRHRGPLLTSRRKPELLFIGTQLGAYSAAERWPIVKALSQFGTLASVSAATARQCSLDNKMNIVCTPPYADWRDYATFEWLRAVYTSPYVTFVHKDLVDRNLHLAQKPSRKEWLLLQRYLGLRPTTSAPAILRATLPTNSLITTEPFPLVSIGGYLQAGVDIAIPGDLTATNPPLNLPFVAIQKSLQSGKPEGGAPAPLIQDYNAEANAITALICYSDGLRPVSVCSRGVIKTILKHIK
jgi:hypothetical protein